MMLQYGLLLFYLCYGTSGLNQNPFPKDFLLGTATSSYQIEGGWDANGKGENIWDVFTHEHPELIVNGSNGNIACDSYNKYETDIKMLKKLGVDFYRFSISWSRILPTGLSDYVNPDGVRYYNNLIDSLIDKGITPMATMFHWDTPQHLESFGGFTNNSVVSWFTDYADILFELFGDRVKLWITFNEPKQTCLQGYGLGALAPGYRLSGTADYLCAHNILKAHGSVYHLYKNKYKRNQKGKIGFTADIMWSEPKTSFEKDIKAAERNLLFTFGLYTDPIFHRNGDYPKVVKDFVNARSKEEGFENSRLPEFTESEINYIKGTFDFMGLNHYTSRYVEDAEASPIGYPSQENDARIKETVDPNWELGASYWFYVVPWGFTKSLQWIKSRYGDIEIYVTENGFSDVENLDDQRRINYFQQYLSALLDAIYDHQVNVKAYTAWSLMDNFEWGQSYESRFGLFHVNFTDPERKRSPKASFRFFKKVIKYRRL